MLYESPFEVKNVDETYSELAKSRGVIVFGTGNCGNIVIAALKKANVKIVYLSDNNKSKWGTNYLEYKILPPEELKGTNNQFPVLVASDLSFKYIKNQLRDLGITNVLDCDFIFSKLDLQLSDCDVTWSKIKIKQKIDLYMFSLLASKEKHRLFKVSAVDLVLTEKCSLKCIDCSNLMQYYAKPVDEDHDQVISSIDTFMSLVDYVLQIRVIGGEPLMYKKIDSIVKHLLTFDNVETIQINTNGTIVPNDEKMKVFENNKVYFDISNYGSSSRNVDKLIGELSRRNIRYNAANVTSWTDCGRLVETNRSESDLKEVFGNCCENQGLTILHGKVYLCPFSAHSTNLNAVKPNSNDVIDLEISDKVLLKEKIKNLYFNTEYLEACKSCNGRDNNVRTIDAALQTKTPLKYNMVAQ